MGVRYSYAAMRAVQARIYCSASPLWAHHMFPIRGGRCTWPPAPAIARAHAEYTVCTRVDSAHGEENYRGTSVAYSAKAEIPW